MSRKCVMGIDPGKTGGFGIFDMATGDFVSAGPLVFGDARKLYDKIVQYDVAEVLFERAQAARGDAGQFEYGRSFGQSEGAAMVAGAKLYYCAPQWWKARLNVSTDKARSYAKAVSLWPELEWLAPPGARGGLGEVHGIAEACLIGSVLTSERLFRELVKNNDARIKKSTRRKPRFDWKGA